MKIVDGNKACSKIAYLFSEICSIYPITPSSTMASNIDYLTNTDLKNIYGSKPKVIEMQSEGILNGFEDGTFRPDDKVTREQFAKILVASIARGLST